MITTYDYTLPENNCFIVKHSNKYYNDYVESVIIDLDENILTINYRDIKTIPVEEQLILEIYNKFGILVDTKLYTLTKVIGQESTPVSKSISYNI